MRKMLAICALITLTIMGCKKDVAVVEDESISQDILAQVHQHGFGTSDVKKVEEGYLVEGDIILTPEFLNSKPGGNFLRIANEEQYRTTNLVTGTPRNITMSLHSKLSSQAGYSQALQEVADRYNAETIGLTFSVVASGGTIQFVNGNGPYLASAGFPSGGNPYNKVTVYSRNIGKGTTPTFINYLATILAHEVGHCIGFRHTDYMNRAYSCGGSATNEGASTVGAVHIAGTPTGPDAGSFMLACIGSGQNRPFNTNDKIALDVLY
ncbi:MAG: protease [Chitinophagaceae bacterium]|jgi:hypothetical protein|nr:protease [Chitinophagaceae bacterium]